MAEHVLDHHDAVPGVQPRGHGPFDVARIADVDVVVHHSDHLERRECREGRHQRLLGPAGALLRDLHHGVVEAAAAVREVDVLHAGHLLLQQRQHVGLAEQAHRIEHLGARQDGLEHRAATPVDALDARQRARRDRRIVAGHLGERAFLVELARRHLALEREHGVGHHLHRRDGARHQLERPAVELAGDAQLVGVDGGRLGGRGCGEVQARADAHVERERQRLAAGERLVQVGLEVTPGIDVDRQPVLADHHEALDRGVAHTGLGIAGNDHRGVEVGPAVELGVGRDRQRGEIDRRLAHLQDRSAVDHHRVDRALLPVADAIGDVLRQRLLAVPEEVGQQRARPVQAGEHRVAAAPDLLEQQRARSALELRGDAGQLMHRIDLRVHAHQSAAAIEPLDDRAEIGDHRHAGLLLRHAHVPRRARRTRIGPAPYRCRLSDSNGRPIAYKAIALPAELSRRAAQKV